MQVSLFFQHDFILAVWRSSCAWHESSMGVFRHCQSTVSHFCVGQYTYVACLHWNESVIISVCVAHTGRGADSAFQRGSGPCKECKICIHAKVKYLRTKRPTFLSCRSWRTKGRWPQRQISTPLRTQPIWTRPLKSKVTDVASTQDAVEHVESCLSYLLFNLGRPETQQNVLKEVPCSKKVSCTFKLN